MRIVLLVFFVVGSLFGLQAQTKSDSIKPNTSLPQQLSVGLQNPIQIKDITEKKADSGLEKNMPWIIALTIGLLSVLVNFWVAHRLRQSNERNLQKQIEHAREITITQFKATIATKNRQEWMNELRNELSELVSCSKSFATLRAIFSKEASREEVLTTFNRMAFNQAKIKLMLNKEKEEQAALIEKADNLMAKCVNSNPDSVSISTAAEEMIDVARKLFDIHWQKIKDLK